MLGNLELRIGLLEHHLQLHPEITDILQVIIRMRRFGLVMRIRSYTIDRTKRYPRNETVSANYSIYHIRQMEGMTK